MKNIIALVLVCASLVGCASTKTVVSKAYAPAQPSQLLLYIKIDPNVSIPEDQFQFLDSQIRNGLSENGLLAQNEEISQHIVNVQIHTFRIRNDAARLAVGILAGCDNIESTVVVSDKITKQELGRSEISINECAAWGVANQVIGKYTDGVLTYLARH